MQASFDTPIGMTPGPEAHLPHALNWADADVRQEVASQFEGVFVSMLLKELRQTLQDGLFGGDQSDTYGALFDLHLGQHLADRGALGIRQMVLSQYQANQEKGV
jgi:Rod binding domain-containing protein